jgi:MFS family permease
MGENGPVTTSTRRPAWWGGRGHILFTVVVFVILASLDNAAIAVIPGMVNPIVDALDTSKTAITLMTGTAILVTALTAVGWGYWGDRAARKRLLFYGTLVWATGAGLSSTADGYGQLFAFQLITAIGLGSIASVGFSVISDLVKPERRGLAMSFWGLSQGIGTIVGGLMSSQLGADNFRVPLAIIAALGLAFALLYLVTFDVPRGFREPALEDLEGEYEYRIEPSHVPTLWQVRTNRWLVLQGLSAQVAYGSLVWVPLLYQEKVLAEGYSTATANRVGGLFATLITVGALASVLGGHIGDRLQRRSLRGRAIISAIGILGAIPFFVAFFFIPLKGIEVTNGAGTLTLLGEINRALFTNVWVAAAFVTALLAIAFTSADSPNWFALISDVNLPEHRGTVFGLGNLANGIGRSSGNALTGAVAGGIETAIPPPLNWAVGLAVFQVFFLPTGYCYWRAAETSPDDIRAVAAELEQRAERSHIRRGPDDADQG